MEKLSPAERECLALLVHGYTYAAIARQRGVTEKTIKAQLGSAYRKIGARNAAHAAYLWCRMDGDSLPV